MFGILTPFSVKVRGGVGLDKFDYQMSIFRFDIKTLKISGHSVIWIAYQFLGCFNLVSIVSKQKFIL